MIGTDTGTTPEWPGVCEPLRQQACDKAKERVGIVLAAVYWARVPRVVSLLAHDDHEALRSGRPKGPPTLPTHTWGFRVGFDTRSFFPWSGRSPVLNPDV